MIKLIVFSLLGKQAKRPELIFKLIKSYLIIYMMLLPSLMKAQSFEWVQSMQIDYSLNPEFNSYLVSGDQNGNIYWGGLLVYHEHYSLESFGDLVINKLNENGNLYEQFFCYGSGSVAAMAIDNEGNLLVHFHLLSDLLLDSSDTLHYNGSAVASYLVKFNSDFELLWEKAYSSSGFGLQACLEVDQDNNIYVGVNELQNTYISILEPNGNEAGQITQENVNLISSISIDGEGNIYAAGSCASNGATFGGELFEPDFPYTNYLVKYTSNHEPQWVKFIEDVTCPFLMVECNDPEHVYFAGPLFQETSFDNIIVDGPNWVFDFYLARLNAQGDFLWVQEIPNTQILGDGSTGKLNFLNIDQNNNAYVAGFIRGTIEWGNGVISESTDIGYDLLALKYNPDGEVLYGKTAGGASFDKAISAYVNPNGDFFIAGFGGDTISLDTISLYQEGYDFPFLTKITDNNINTGLLSNSATNDIEVYPNPTSDLIHVTSIENQSIVSISIANLSGLIIEDFNYDSASKATLKTNHLESGIFFLYIKTNNHKTFRKKIIKL